MFIKRFRLFVGLTLAVVAVATTVNFALAAQTSPALSNSSQALQATAAATAAAAAPNFALCQEPTATPGGTEPPTAAAPAATEVATQAAAPATAAATAAAAKPTATKPPTKTPTPVPPTAIPKGKKPATAGLVLNVNNGEVRASGKCLNVLAITAGGPADVAGIQKGDYVLGVDAVETAQLADFYNEINKHSSGDTVTITVQREDQVMPLKVVLGLNQFAK
jgi:hypothetical protein